MGFETEIMLPGVIPGVNMPVLRLEPGFCVFGPAERTWVCEGCCKLPDNVLFFTLLCK